MKKLLAFILVAIMAFSMVACGGGEANEGGEASGEGTTDSQPVGEVESKFDFKKLTSYGLPEPEFAYSYQFYSETMQGMGEDGEPILRPKYTFKIDTDRTGAHEYMGRVKNAGWAGDIPYLAQEKGGAFWFVSENENYKINITWNDDTESGDITVIDMTNFCVWDGAQSIYIIEGTADFNNYAPYGNA